MSPKPDRRSVLRLPLLAAFLNLLPATATESTAMSAADHVHDFDFLFGSWKVRHRYLKARLAHSNEWIEFDGACKTQPTMNGAGNVDDNVLEKPDGAYRAVGFRAYDPKTQSWAIWWVDGRNPHGPVDPPVIGTFKDGVGTFLADDTFNGRKVKLRFEWSAITPTSAHWEQALSDDGGATWEVNWRMDFTRVA